MNTGESFSEIPYTAKMEIIDKGLIFFSLLLLLLGDVWASFFYGLGSVVYFIRFLGLVVFLYSLLGYGRKFDSTRVGAYRGRQFMCLLALLFLLLFTFIEILILQNEKDDIIPAQTRYAIVLGAGLYGETPSLTLQSRLVRALDYMNNNPESIAILSGGQGEDELISEAEAMRRYLTRNGIAEERLWLEDKSTSTSENFSYSRNILQKKLGLGEDETVEIVIISSDFHLYRAKLLAKRNHLQGYGLSCPTPKIRLLPAYYHFREAASIIFAYLGR